MVQTHNAPAFGRNRSGGDRPPLYQFIVDDVIEKIRSGELVAGDQLDSVGAMCRHYDVAAATAHRSMQLLEQMGVIRTVPRKGAYVVGVPTPPAVKAASQVQRVLLVDAVANRHSKRSAPQAHGRFSDPAVEAIVRHCRQTGLPLAFQVIPTGASAAPRIFFTPRSGDAIIAIGAQVSTALLSHMATPNVPSVLIDAAAPNAHCVLTDNYDGMHQVVSHLRDHGHRRIVLGFCFQTRLANTTNENERRDGLLHHAAIAGLHATTVDSGEWDDMFAVLKGPTKPTAVVFTRDDAAIAFIRLARQRGMDVPRDVSVIGFDDWASNPADLEELTTVHVEIEQLGRVAVEMVTNPPPNRNGLFHWRRVRPRLVSRSSVASIDPSQSGSSR